MKELFAQILVGLAPAALAYAGRKVWVEYQDWREWKRCRMVAQTFQRSRGNRRRFVSRERRATTLRAA